MTKALREYLELERLMLIFDEESNPAAEALRDAMDPIWYRLSDQERRLLNERAIGRVKSIEEIRLPAGDRVFGPPPAPPQRRTLPKEVITKWTLAA
jgi:hypothetical protein